MDTSQAGTALLTEHLQYTPLSLIDDIIDSVNNLVYQGVGSLETGLLATPPERLGFKVSAKDDTSQPSSEPEYLEAQQEIEEGLHKLETLLNSTIDKNFDKFEIYVLRNILSVPPDLVNWVRLDHYEGIDRLVPDHAPNAASIELLRQKLAASRRINKALQTERRRNEAVLARLRELTGSANVSSSSEPSLAFLGDQNVVQALGNLSPQPLTTNTTFTLSQLPALKLLLQELRQQLSDLKKAPSRSETAKDELREERREYIEQRTQSHLHRNARADLEGGSVIGGREYDPAEIEALEKVAATFHQP